MLMMARLLAHAGEADRHFKARANRNSMTIGMRVALALIPRRNHQANARRR